MYDVLFINAHRHLGNASYEWQSCLGLMSMAAFLEKNGIEARVFNCNYYDVMESFDSNDDLHCKVLGLYCDFDNVFEVINISLWVKENWHIPVIVGGPQSKHLTKDFFLKSMCDVVVRGEGELTIVDLVNFFLESTGSLEEIRGISYLRNDEIVMNEDQALIENLDVLPYCDEKYIVNKKKHNNFWVCMTGRGCPFSCSFCFEALSSKKVRFRSVTNVLVELSNKFSAVSTIKYLMFADDTFTLIPERVKKLCDGIIDIRKHKDFIWYCEGHVSTLLQHPEMIDYMVAAGMVRLQLGIESGNEHVLRAYNKGCTPDDIITLVKICKEKGVKSVYGNIILGSAFFTKKTFECDLEFAQKLLEVSDGIVELAVIYYWPLPGTRMTNNPDTYGIKLEDTDFVTCMMDLPQTSTDEYTLWDIQGFGYKLNERLNDTVLNMIRSGKISRSRILDWYCIEKKYGSSISIWHNLVKKYGEVDRYFVLLVDRNTVCESEVEDNSLLNLHPIRLVDLATQFDGNKIVNVLFDCVELDAIDLEVLRYSYGKLAVEEILSILKEKFSCVFKDSRNAQKVILSKLRRLENFYFISFGKY